LTGKLKARVVGIDNRDLMQAVFALSLMVIFALPTISCEGKGVSDKTKNRSSQNQPSPLATASPQKRVAEGRWGGQHLRLEVSADGAEFEFDCAHGRLTGPLTLNNGRFAAAGTYVRERGRVRMDDSEEGQRVYFKGQVEGSRMTLSFSLAEDGSEAETFTLIHGAEAKLFKCK
jgi:hypothetical protein